MPLIDLIGYGWHENNSKIASHYKRLQTDYSYNYSSKVFALNGGLVKGQNKFQGTQMCPFAFFKNLELVTNMLKKYISISLTKITLALARTSNRLFSPNPKGFMDTSRLYHFVTGYFETIANFWFWILRDSCLDTSRLLVVDISRVF